jgi:predicted nucleic acid-binding protein
MSSPFATRFVVDASIATKWYLRDEELAIEAAAIFEDFRVGRIDLLAPDHIQQEVANAVRNAVRRARITEAEAHAAVSAVLGWAIPMIATSTLLASGMTVALRYDCALYDALYIALAERANCEFIYADRRLHNTLRGRFARALWIEEYVRT